MFGTGVPAASAPLGLRRGVERPKPLRLGATLPAETTAAAKMDELETLVARLTLDPGAASRVNAALKAWGKDLEEHQPDRLDQIQGQIHAACRESRLDQVSKLHLLEVIELRAMHWVPNDKVAGYYKQKLAESVSAPPCSTLPTPVVSGDVRTKDDCSLDKPSWMSGSNNRETFPQVPNKGDHKFEVAVGDEKIFVHGSNANLVRGFNSNEALRPQRSLQSKRLSAPLVNPNSSHSKAFWGSSSQSMLLSNENADVSDGLVKLQISMFEKIALESAPQQKYYREESSTVFEDFDVGESNLPNKLPNNSNILANNASCSLKTNTGTSKLASAMTMSTRKCETSKSRRSYDHRFTRYSLDFQQLSAGQDTFTSDRFQEPFEVFQRFPDALEMESICQSNSFPAMKKQPPPKPRRTSLGHKPSPPIDTSKLVSSVQEPETYDASKSFGSFSSKEPSFTNSVFQSYSIDNFLKSEGIGVKVLNTKSEFELKNMENAVAMSALPDGNIIVTFGGDDHLHMLNSRGKMIKKVRPITRFRRPTDLATFSDGNFVVRSESAICLFDKEGNLIRLIGEKNFAKSFGLATDGQSHLIAISIGTNKSSSLTKPGETDILFVDINTGRISRRIELGDIIEDKSKYNCRFVSCDGNRIFVVDSGLDCVYAIDISTNLVKTYGSRGNQFGRFVEPTGMAIDRSGNVIIADSKNHRLQIFDRSLNFVGIVKTSVTLRRPSVISLDPCSQSILILNSWSNSLLKLSFE